MDIEVRRYLENGKAVLGRLFLDNVYFCDTLEPPFREKYGAIPYGRYIGKILWSSKFSCPVLYLMVDGRSGIEFHKGNIPENTRGCILVGYNPVYQSAFLQYSTIAFNRLMMNLDDADQISFNVVFKYDTTFSCKVSGA